MKPIEINVKQLYSSAELFARKVWQELFSIYRSNFGDINNMDSLLCDLDVIGSYFKKSKSFTIYWYFNCSYTDINEFKAHEINSYKIEYKASEGRIIIGD